MEITERIHVNEIMIYCSVEFKQQLEKFMVEMAEKNRIKFKSNDKVKVPTN